MWTNKNVENIFGPNRAKKTKKIAQLQVAT